MQGWNTVKKLSKVRPILQVLLTHNIPLGVTSHIKATGFSVSAPGLGTKEVLVEAYKKS